MKPKKGKKGFEGYKKVASSKSLNALAAKKRAVSRENPKAEYKFTKDAEGNTSMYAKYKKGGPIKGKTVTKEMVDKEFAHNFEVNANLTNKMAKQASTGLKKNGFPMKPANVKSLKEQVKKRKEKEGKAKPNYRYVGTKVPGGPTPRFKKGGKMKKYLKGGQVKLDANKDGKISGEDFKMLRKK